MILPLIGFFVQVYSASHLYSNRRSPDKKVFKKPVLFVHCQNRLLYMDEHFPQLKGP